MQTEFLHVLIAINSAPLIDPGLLIRHDFAPTTTPRASRTTTPTHLIIRFIDTRINVHPKLIVLRPFPHYIRLWLCLHFSALATQNWFLKFLQKGYCPWYLNWLIWFRLFMINLAIFKPNCPTHHHKKFQRFPTTICPNRHTTIHKRCFPALL